MSPPIVPGFTFAPGAVSRYLLDGNHAWVADTAQPRQGGTGGPLTLTVYGTANGGRSWQQGTPITGLNPYGLMNPQVFFLDATRGWLLLLTLGGSDQNVPNLYSTSDAGRHWNLLTQFPQMSGGCAPMPVFATVSTGWMAATCGTAAPTLLVTHDGGASWRAQSLPVVPASGEWFDNPVFRDQLHGTVVLHAQPSLLLVTSDGGNTWAARALPGEVQRDISFVDANHVWVIAGSSAEMSKFAPVPS